MSRRAARWKDAQVAPVRPTPRGDAVALPRPLTSLLGREREIATALAMLDRPDVRLLTLTGPGGVGKTRLAIEVARAAVPRFADGVRFVPLDAVPDAGQVAPAVLRALGLREHGPGAARDALAVALRDADLLLVLDNFEHLLEAAPLLSELLATCPRLTLLVTSRALLRVAGEQALPAPPLALPDPRRSSLEDVARSPAVQLFADRAHAVDPAFALSEATAPLVAEICRRLDGLPLAIELVAAQVAVFPPAALLRRIEAQQPLPHTGPRDAPRRLRTMADAVAWSYDLLTADEQRLFRRLSVFAGGFSLEAAEAVCRGQGDRRADEQALAQSSLLTPQSSPSSRPPVPLSPSVLDGLASLVLKSLVRREEGDGEARYAMLETIRSFAGDRLADSGEADDVGEAHAAWALALAEAAAEAFKMLDRERQIPRLGSSYANLIVALRWFDRRGDVARLLRLTAALGIYWVVYGPHREGRDWLERALALAPAAPSPARARAQIALGPLVALFGEVERADRLLSDGIAVLRKENASAALAFALLRLGCVATQIGQYDRAERLHNELIELAAALDDRAVASRFTASALANLGVAAQGRGDLDQAQARYEAALATYRGIGALAGMSHALRDLGDLHRDRGDFARSLACYRESLDVTGARDDLIVVFDALEGAALAAAAWSLPVQAARLLGAAEALRELYGGTFMVATDQAAHGRTHVAISAAPDGAAIQVALEAGRRLSVAEAIEELRALTPVDNTARPLDAADAKLSPRETEILHLLVAGKTDREIAEALFVSVRTVEAHVRHILAKLSVRTRTAAVGAAFAAGLAEPALPIPPSPS